MRLSPSLVLAALALTACASGGSSNGVDVSRGNATATAHMRRQVEEMRYMRGEELVRRMEFLASAGEDGIDAVTEGASSDDWLVRMGCMYVMGATGDRRTIPALASRLDDPVPQVRYEAAASLVKLGDGRGFKLLVEGLADSDLQLRYKCFQRLRAATGRDFGYRHDADPLDRRQAVGRWLEWLDGVSPSAL